MTLSHRRHRRTINPNLQDDCQLLLIMPATPPLPSQNIAPHRKLRLRHVINDVAMHVS